jgi:hypothetical protein
MRTLASDLGLHVEKLASQPRIYADANGSCWGGSVQASSAEMGCLGGS